MDTANGNTGLDTEVDPPNEPLTMLFRRPILGLPGETGWHRVRQLYNTYDGKPAPEMALVANAAISTATVAFMYGGLNYWRQARETFDRRNTATSYLTQQFYLRNRKDFQILKGALGGYKLAWRCGLFSGLYTLGVMTGSVYRNEFGVAEHVAMGTLLAGLSRMHLGLRAIAAGSTIGALIGSLMGVTLWALTRIAGVTVQQARLDYHEHCVKLWESHYVETQDQYLHALIDNFTKLELDGAAATADGGGDNEGAV